VLGRDPQPRVAHLHHHRARLAPHHDAHVARLGELDRVAHQVLQQLEQPRPVGLHDAGARRHVGLQAEAAGQGVRRGALGQAAHQLVQVGGPQAGGGLGRFHAHVAQHLVHHAHQVACAVADAPHVALLHGRQRPRVALGQQVAEAGDGVQRRLQLVRDHGQEVALGAAGGLRLGAGHALAQQQHLALGLGQLAGRDVLGDAVHAGDGALAHHDGHQRQRQLQRAPRAVRQRHVGVLRLAFRRPGEEGAHPLSVGRRRQQGERRARQLLGGPAHQRGGGRVGALDAAA
jgi:hypothetical protein